MKVRDVASGHWVKGARNFGLILKVAKSFFVDISAPQTRPSGLLAMSVTNCPQPHRHIPRKWRPYI